MQEFYVARDGRRVVSGEIPHHDQNGPLAVRHRLAMRLNAAMHLVTPLV